MLRWSSAFVLGCSLNGVVAQASTVGNGGDGLVCRSDAGAIQSIEFLDYFEGRVLRAVVPDLGEQQLSVEAKVGLALGRLADLDHERFLQYSAEFGGFFANVQWVRGVNLIDIPDYGQLPIDPTHCKLEQLAIQRKPEIPGDKRYIINGDLWDQMSNDSKAGLVLHEIIYRDAIQRGHTNSMMVRYFNTLVSSHRLDGMSPADYIQLLSTLALDVYQWKDEEADITWQYMPRPVLTGEEAGASCAKLEERYPGTRVKLAPFSRLSLSAQGLRHSPLAEVIGPTLWISLADYPEMPVTITFPGLHSYMGTSTNFPYLCSIKGL